MKTVLLLFSVVSLIFCSIQPVNATIFEESGFRLAHNPTICALGPVPNPSIPNLEDRMSSETQYAIQDWKNKLDSGNRHSVWDMTLITVHYTQVKNFDSSKCDIQISFLSSPTNTPDTIEPVGYTQYNFTNHTAKIVIYYQQLVFSIIDHETSDSRYIYHQYTPVSQYFNKVAPDSQLRMTFDHELGHALGLGHYQITNEEIYNLESGKELEVPSIMVPIVVPAGNTHYSITPVDVQQLKSLYGESGFKTSTKTSNSIPPNIPSLTVNTNLPLYKTGNQIIISGKVTNSKPGDTVTTSISQPEGSIISNLVKVNSDGTYSTTYKTNSWKSGSYIVNAFLDFDITHKTSTATSHTTFRFLK